MDWIRRHVLATALVGAAVLLAATAAYASSRLAAPAPSASELPVVRTARPLVAAVPATTAPTPAAPGGGTSKPNSSGGASGVTVSSGVAAPSHKKASASSGRGTTSPPSDHEVVTPPVHDSDDQESDHSGTRSDSRSVTGHVGTLGSDQAPHDRTRALGDKPHSGGGGD